MALRLLSFFYLPIKKGSKFFKKRSKNNNKRRKKIRREIINYIYFSVFKGNKNLKTLFLLFSPLLFLKKNKHHVVIDASTFKLKILAVLNTVSWLGNSTCVFPKLGRLIAPIISFKKYLYLYKKIVQAINPA